MNKNRSAIIFDFDGVIIDSVDPCVLAFNKYFKRGWINREFKTKYEFKGFFNKDKSFLESISKIVTSKENLNSLIEHHKYKDNYYVQSTLVKDSKKIIEYFHKKGCSLGIVSSNLRLNIESILKREKIKHCFEFIISGDTNLEGKTISEKSSPEGILYGLKLIRIEPENAMFVGDAGTDILAGKNAGIGFMVAKAQDNLDFEYLSNFNPAPDKVIKNLDELKLLVYQSSLKSFSSKESLKII